MIRISLRFLAGGKTAVIVPVEFDDAPPDLLERFAVLLFAGDPVELRQCHDRMQTFPSRLRRFEELHALQGQLQVIARQRLAFPASAELVDNLQRKLELAVALRLGKP